MLLQHKQSDLDRQLSAAKAAAEQLATSMQVREGLSDRRDRLWGFGGRKRGS